MRSKRNHVFAAALLALLVAVAAGSCSSDKPTDLTNNNTDNTAQDAVAIVNFAFSPANKTVKVGTKVTWTNNDNSIHTVTSDDGGFTSSGNLAQDDTHEVTFTAVGTYPYHCEIHPAMTGTITVTE